MSLTSKSPTGIRLNIFIRFHFFPVVEKMLLCTKTGIFRFLPCNACRTSDLRMYREVSQSKLHWFWSIMILAKPHWPSITNVGDFYSSRVRLRVIFDVSIGVANLLVSIPWLQAQAENTEGNPGLLLK